MNIPEPGVDPCSNSGESNDVADNGAVSAAPASAAASAETTTTPPGIVANVLKQQHSNSSSPLGDASGVALLLGNHAEFGLAERCWYVTNNLVVY